mmetsp:Transcript_21351/g.45450  ORF Transcript_21351/g.45450 Transcript_21351/m.45450 type:complete len:306 (+) Transcript_21351:1177-2094(+)
MIWSSLLAISLTFSRLKGMSANWSVKRGKRSGPRTAMMSVSRFSSSPIPLAELVVSMKPAGVEDLPSGTSSTQSEPGKSFAKTNFPSRTLVTSCPWVSGLARTTTRGLNTTRQNETLVLSFEFTELPGTKSSVAANSSLVMREPCTASVFTTSMRLPLHGSVVTLAFPLMSLTCMKELALPSTVTSSQSGIDARRANMNEPEATQSTMAASADGAVRRHKPSKSRASGERVTCHIQEPPVATFFTPPATFLTAAISVVSCSGVAAVTDSFSAVHFSSFERRSDFCSPSANASARAAESSPLNCFT